MRIKLILFASACVLLLAACGGGGPEPVSFDVMGQDSFRYDPNALTVETGAEVTINFQNAGVLEHSWLLLPNRIDPLEAQESDAMAGASTGIVPGGQSKNITFIAPAAGTYTFACTVPGHAQAGKIGTLTVTDS